MVINKKGDKMLQTRNTDQKLKILLHLRSVKTHPTAESVYEQVKKDIPAISLATVYRNLNTMAAQGKILRLEINKEYHYDADISFHQHCVCNACGRIDDMFQYGISEYALKNFKNKKFKPVSVSVIFRGFCKDCSNGGKTW